ncbi:MAG: tagaturonate epimerase family protein [Agathobaculum sp.]|jgi:hypothetical protein|uniref:tagaturonate epimerase family protein n=1 Tax=Agathobaculum sp. TaxID=2048138 RepID=UPI003D8AAD57
MTRLNTLLPALQQALQEKPVSVYPESCFEVSGGELCIADFGAYDALLFWGENCPFAAAESALMDGLPLAKVALDHDCAAVLHRLLPFTAPKPVLSRERTFGMGDRLGIATLGHIRAAKKFDIYPVFAQQSMRELTLMCKTYDDVIDRVTFQVLQAGFTKGYGADGDHLKTLEEVNGAIASGCTMITLDCSEHIRGEGAAMDAAALSAACPLSAELEQRYLGQTFAVGGTQIAFTREDLQRCVIIYGEAIGFAKKIYDCCIAGKEVELEISIDETATPTTPAQHFFAANELTLAGVQFITMAPRFCGEFQKGIDYIGDLEQFDREFAQHVAIAEHFGYKISVHSGSDKFSVYPSVGRMTHGRFHVKTSGTSWLEAVRLVAQADPALFRELYQYALGVFEEARAYYHVSAELEQMPPIDGYTDDRLTDLLELPASRQLMHITYGKIMNEVNPDGSLRFKNRLYDLLREHREEYTAMLEKHMEHHLGLLFSQQ